MIKTPFRSRLLGFTMVELLMIIIIISILFLMVTHFLFDAPDEAKTAKATIEMKQIADACVQFNRKNGEFPRKFSELVSGGYYPGAPATPYGTKYELDGNFVICPLVGNRGDSLKKVYNKALILDEFQDLQESYLFWSNTGSLVNFDYAGDDAGRSSKIDGTYVKSPTKLTSKLEFSFCDITAIAALPARNPDNPTVELASSLSITLGALVNFKWVNEKDGRPLIKVTAGGVTITDKFVGDNNPHEFKISVRSFDKTKWIVRYFVDGKPLNPSGDKVSPGSSFLELDVTKDVYLEKLEVIYAD